MAVATMLAGGSGIGGWASWLQWSGNIHTVVEGELYRSARLSADTLEDLIRIDGIRSVVNLDGARPGRDWYQAEQRITSASEVELIDFRWRADTAVTPEEVDAFLDAVRDAPKPILIHCRSGSDRTGLASALYLATFKGADAETAAAQLSFRYGHVGIPYTAAWPMDETFTREIGATGLAPD